jgi:hypothetical protein
VEPREPPRRFLRWFFGSRPRMMPEQYKAYAAECSRIARQTRRSCAQGPVARGGGSVATAGAVCDATREIMNRIPPLPTKAKIFPKYLPDERLQVWRGPHAAVRSELHQSGSTASPALLKVRRGHDACAHRTGFATRSRYQDLHVHHLREFGRPRDLCGAIRLAGSGRDGLTDDSRRFRFRNGVISESLPAHARAACPPFSPGEGN